MNKKHLAGVLLLASVFARECYAAEAWLDSIDDGYRQAQAVNRPILLFVGDDTISASREIWNALQSKAVTMHLGLWTLVHVPFDKNTVRQLGLIRAPSIRLMGVDGKVFAEMNESLPAEQIAAFLVKNEKLITAAPAVKTIDALDSRELISRLGDSDTATREQAIRALRNDRSAAPQVIEALSGNNLAARISAVDLLEQWGANVNGVDPWNSKSISQEKLSELSRWAKALPPTTAATQSTINVQSVAQEIDLLIAAQDAVEARAVRERLVRFGESALPVVYDRLKSRPEESTRRRLIAARYRVVATDRLARDWPGGFDRLASVEPEQRRTAMGELAKIAKPEDHRLLTELFSDEDPFVREQSLKLLRSVGGPETGHALMSLLGDPEPNVRAAVLKTLADSPDEALSKELIKYVGTETDTDLVVHAVHVLQATPGAETFECLKRLLTHKQWRVRGEAAEAMLGKLSGPSEGGLTEEQKASAYASLTKCLEDSDGYVVNRAAFTLIKSDFAGSAQALMKAAEHRPDLAKDVLQAVSRDETTGKLLLPQIRELTKNARPEVRAAAVMAVAKLVPATSGSVIKAAIADPDRQVHLSAVRATATVVNELLPRNGTVERSSFFGLRSSVEHVEIQAWVAGFRKGVDRPTWINEISGELQKSLTEADARVQAAVTLCALGKEGDAWPVLVEAVNVPGQRNDAAKAMAWLPWEKRMQLFQLLRKNSKGGEQAQILQEFVTVPDSRSATAVWEMLVGKDAMDHLSSVHDALRMLYFGEQYYNTSSLPVEKKVTITNVLKEKAKSGAELERTVALSLLMTIAPDVAAASARAIYDDPKSTEWARLDSLQIRLLGESEELSKRTAAAALADKAMRKIAVPYLAIGDNSITELRGVIRVFSSNSHSTVSFTSPGTPILVNAAEGLTVEPVRDVLAQAKAEKNADLAAYASYLMATLGDFSELDQLIATAKAHTDQDYNSEWSRMVYRAIAKSNDDSKVPVLEEIYHLIKARNEWALREFYWTIRPMNGPNVLKLRKTMRTEVGMEKLQ